MEKPKVLLLYPPNQMWPIETPRPDGSIGPLYLAGALEAAGFEADILDTTVGSKDDSLADTFYRSIMQVNGLTRIGMSLERIRDFVLAGKYNIVGISSNFTSQTRMALEVAAEIKQANPDIWVIAGGGNARNLWSRFLNGSFDLVCLTEGERIIVEIAKEWPGGFERISGVAYKKEGRQIVNPVKPDDIYSKLDQLPFPAWEKLLFYKYDQIASPHGVVVAKEKHRCAPVMTSRGCPYHCEYCHVSYEKLHPEAFGPIGNLRFKSVNRVMEEIFRLKDLGVSRIFFEDDSLLADKKRVKAIFEQVSNLGLTIADVNGVNLVHFLKPIGERLTV
ncbi:MAG: cobalamin-dependent protein, partial [Patescibacteria group bacterium]